MATILVTGGSGMLGQHLVPMLKENGHLVQAPSRQELNLTDAQATLSFLKDKQIDVVVHCAAYVAGIASSKSTKHHSLDVNVAMGLNLIRACLQQGVSKLINVGSATVYPNNAEQPLAESSIGQGPLEEPIEGYALSKYLVYRACAMANEQHNVSFKTILPCNLFGPFDNFSVETGHMLLQFFIECIKPNNKEMLLSLYGAMVVPNVNSFTPPIWRILFVILLIILINFQKS